MKKLIWLYIALITIIFLLLLIIFSKLTIHINFFHHNDNDELKVELRIWFGLIKYKMNIPLIKIDDNSPSLVVKGNTQLGDSSEKNSTVEQITQDDIITKLTNAKEIIQHVFKMNVIVSKFLKRIVIKHFEWHTLVGLGDAAHTGIITGALWSIKGGIIGILSNFMRLKKMPILSVTPHFQLAIIQTRITCIFQFRIGYAILAGLKLIKFWKGGRPNFKTNAAYSKEKTKTV